MKKKESDSLIEQHFSEEDLVEIENQLSCPAGENGIEMGHRMQENNHSMVMSTIQNLELSADDKVLEIGPGNGYHVEKIVKAAPGIQYEGLDISDTMLLEAARINEPLKSDCHINFTKYDGQNIPFADAAFTKIMTVNTLYFWQAPEAFIQELERVLKPGGLLIITFAEKEFMKKLPFVKDKFTMYGEQEFRALIDTSTLKIRTVIKNEEEIKSKSGESVERVYLVALVEKS